jgi:hypothetical protein
VLAGHGIRKDAWVMANPIVVEREKPKRATGYFERAEADAILCK